jgi:hypothetical protein
MRSRHVQTRLVVVLAVAVAAGAVRAATELHRVVVAGGGTGAAAPAHDIRSTLGQPVAGPVAAAVHGLRAGFWTSTGSLLDTPADAPLPAAYRLRATAPNPFLGATTIGYEVPSPGGAMVIRIYDVGGRAVRTLVARHEAPGYRTVAWDGRNDTGRSVAPGVYTCEMTAPRFRATTKLVFTGR